MLVAAKGLHEFEFSLRGRDGDFGSSDVVRLWPLVKRMPLKVGADLFLL